MTISKRPPRNARKRPGAVNVEVLPSHGLTVLAYYKQASRTDRFKTSERRDHYRELGFGFFGEVGGLLSALKKGKRDQLTPPQAQVVGEELGDALWYLVNMAALSGLDVEELAKAGLQFLRQYFDEQPKVPPSGLTFKSLDGIAAQHHLQLSRQGDLPLRMLAKDSGEIVVRDLRDVSADKGGDRGQTFGRLLGELALVSARHGLRLELIAQENLRKTADRWPGENPKHVQLQMYGEPHEQLPLKMEVLFTQRKVGNRIVVVQQMKGVNIGDPLTDNSHRPDGYRFHDVFHLAYAVHLGWSPVIRALLKVKRKSDPRIDENEDGARAIIIEEGIATWIFNHSARQSPKHYAAVVEGRLDYALLKTVRGMVSGFEVADLPLWQWERAILDGFRVFRLLFENKGGTVDADLRKRTLTYKPPAATAP